MNSVTEPTAAAWTALHTARLLADRLAEQADDGAADIDQVAALAAHVAASSALTLLPLPADPQRVEAVPASVDGAHEAANRLEEAADGLDRSARACTAPTTIHQHHQAAAYMRQSAAALRTAHPET